jgi:hypothetical protein
MRRILTILGGVLIVASIFPAFFKEINDSLLDLSKEEAYFIIAMGTAIALIALLGNRSLTMGNVLLGIGVLILAFHQAFDIEEIHIGVGLWMMIGGALFSFIGSATQLFKKKL